MASWKYPSARHISPRRQKSLCIAITILSGFACNIAMAAEELSQREVLQKAIEYRQTHFKTGRVVILEELASPDERGSEFQYSATISEGKIKVGRECRLAGMTKWGGKDTFVVTPDTYIENVESHPNIIVRTASGEQIAKHESRRFAFDPRAVGMVFGGASAMGRHGITAFEKFFVDEEAPAIEAEEDGCQVVKIAHQFDDHQRLALTLDPAREYSILSATITRGNLRTEMVTQYQQLPTGWFPKTCTIVSTWDGKVTDSTKLSVTKADFTTDVSDQEFTIEGLQLAAGRVVVDDGGEAQTWNGTKFVPYRPSDFWLQDLLDLE